MHLDFHRRIQDDLYPNEIIIVSFKFQRALFEQLYLSNGGFPGGSDGKKSACSTRDQGLIPGLGRSPGEENGNPLQYFYLENSMGEGAWQATYSPWGCKESDTAERPHSLLSVKYKTPC